MHLQIVVGAFAFASSVMAATHKIKAGTAPTVGGIQYSPAITTAKVGDTIIFEFDTTFTHTVVQGDPANPCHHVKGGLYSTQLTASDKKEFVVTINDTKPIFFYCEVPEHCNMFGMVGGINVAKPALNRFKAAALKATSVSGPTRKTPVGGVLAKAGTQG